MSCRWAQRESIGRIFAAIDSLGYEQRMPALMNTTPIYYIQIQIQIGICTSANGFIQTSPITP